MSRAASLLVLALLVVLVAPSTATAVKRNPQSPQQTVEYWTQERMRNAKPRPLAKPGGGGGGTKTSDWSSYAVPLVDGAYAGENRKNGKVFFTLNKTDYVCSGTAIAASSNVNLVWTAGHCVTDGPDKEASRFIFVPGYYKGQAPNGRWAYTLLDSTPGWEAQGSDKWRHDVGAARVTNADNTSATFAGTIGTRAIAFGQDPTGRRLVSYGYPAAGKFSGEQQHACASPFRRWDGTAFLDPMQISCDMTGGSSGGGWMLDSNANNVGDAGEPLVSVNSYGYLGEKNTMYGPYMAAGGQAQDLYNRMK